MAEPADPLTALAARLGTKPALIEDRGGGKVRQWSFAELEAIANQLARVFLNQGLTPGDRVLWCGHNSLWTVACGHAARKIGAVAVPLNYRLTGEEAAYVVEDSDAKVGFIDAELVPLFESIRDRIPRMTRILTFDGAPGQGMQAAEPLIEAESAEAMATVGEALTAGTMIYTSGTTGKPKGAVRTGIGDPDQLARLLALIGYREDDVYIPTGPLYHSGPSGFLAIATNLGNTAVIQRSFDPEDWLRLVDQYRITSTFSAPTPIRRVCQLPAEVLERYDRSSVRIMIANAAPWSYALKMQYLDKFPEHSLFEVYGSTELGVNTVLLPGYQREKKGSCGQRAPGVEIRLYTEAGEIVTEPHTPGELFVRSPSVFSTYHKAHDKFMAERRDGWQTVGDIAYFDEDGFYYICDRKKDMIISGGVNIYPAEVEDALEHHPDVLEAAVIGIPDEEWGESVHAVVVKRPESDLDEASLQAFGREHLAGYKVPRSVAFIDEIPKTGTGKILKRVLREPFWKDHGSRVV